MPNSTKESPPGFIDASASSSESPERRLTRRISISATLVDVLLSDEPGRRFPVFGRDLNVDGIGLTLREDVAIGSRVGLTFQLDARARLAGVGGRVVHRCATHTGVAFAGWPEEDRLLLLEYLGRRQEAESQED